MVLNETLDIVNVILKFAIPVIAIAGIGYIVYHIFRNLKFKKKQEDKMVEENKIKEQKEQQEDKQPELFKGSEKDVEFLQNVGKNLEKWQEESYKDLMDEKEEKDEYK